MDVRPMIFRFCLWCLLLACMLTGGARPGLAQFEDEISTPEQVAIAFFHAADTNPDFELWAKNTREYKIKSATRASDFLFEEKQRLMRAWRDYDPERDLLLIKGIVDVDLKIVPTKEGDQDFWMYMTFQEGKATYFPYVFQDYKLAIIPQMIENLMMQQISREQYEMMKADFTKSGTSRADLYIQLKPVKAYVNQPYFIDDVEQWAMLADIVSLTLRSQKNEAIFWNYGADWYVSPVNKELRDLYQSPAAEQGGSSFPTIQ